MASMKSTFFARKTRKKNSAEAPIAPVTLMKLLVAIMSPLLVFGDRCCKSVNSGTR